MKKNKSKRFSIQERRNILKVLSAGATLALPGWVFAQNSLWVPEELPLTPQQTEGPFYPEKTIEQQLFNDTDLSRKLKDHEFAKGQQCTISGVVKDQKGKPIQGSVVEIWQACASGRYNHFRDDENQALLDNNFQFWGRAIVGEDGSYSFKTIIPGKYPGRTARHIHYRVEAESYRRCSTQCYFSDFGNDNMRDGLYMDLNRKERELVTIEFDKPVVTKQADTKETENESGSVAKQNEESAIWNGSFDIVMGR